jgi:hypothetical protein
MDLLGGDQTREKEEEAEGNGGDSLGKAARFHPLYWLPTAIATWTSSGLPGVLHM